MVPQLVRLGEEFGIACFSGGGFDGLAGKHDAAMRAVAGGTKSRILHLGDYDQSGEHMFSALAEDVIAFAAAAGAQIEFQRVAITPAQVVTYNLPTAPPKVTDRRSFSGTATTQAEALPPDILAAIVREAIETALRCSALWLSRPVSSSMCCMPTARAWSSRLQDETSESVAAAYLGDDVHAFDLGGGGIAAPSSSAGRRP